MHMFFMLFFVVYTVLLRMSVIDDALFCFPFNFAPYCFVFRVLCGFLCVFIYTFTGRVSYSSFSEFEGSVDKGIMSFVYNR